MKKKLFILFFALLSSFITTSFLSAYPNSISGVIMNEVYRNNKNKIKEGFFYRKINDSIAEPNVAYAVSLSAIFNNPKENEVILLRGKLSQSLNNLDLFVFQDDTAIGNMTINPELWKDVNKGSYELAIDMQFLVIVTINPDTKSVTLNTMKIFPEISKTASYVLSEKDLSIIKEYNKRNLETKSTLDQEESTVN